MNRRKMGYIVNRIMKIILFTVILFTVVFEGAKIVERKKPIEEYRGFFEEKENFDVLMFGSSHMRDFISPMELWNDYGITSYNFGNSGERLPTTYWVMENAIRYKKPKVVIVDMFKFETDSKYSSNIDYVHDSLDSFPLTSTKIAAIHDLFENDEIKYEFLFDVMKYHTRWKDLTKEDFTISDNPNKGLHSLTLVRPQSQCLVVNNQKELTEDMLGVVYLRKLIESCQEKGIDVLLVHTPYVATESEQIAANSVSQIAEEYGVPFINMVALNSVVDTQVDFRDEGHVNASGVQKVTSYIGDYLVSHYNLADHREEERYGGWKKDYKDYTVSKVEALRNNIKLDSSLMLLHDYNFNSCVYIKAQSPFYDNPVYCDLMQNINREHLVEATAAERTSASMITLNKFEEAALEKQSYFLVTDHGKGRIWEISGNESQEIETSFGNLRFCVNETGMPELYLDGNEENLFSVNRTKEMETASPEGAPDVQMIVIDKMSGHVEAAKQFWLTWETTPICSALE